MMVLFKWLSSRITSLKWLPMLIIIVLLIVIKWFYGELKEVSSAKYRAESALIQEKAERKTEREDFALMQKVVDNVSEKNREIHSANEELQKKLKTAQKGSKCVDEPVPDAVNEQLRDRPRETNRKSPSATGTP